MIALGKFSFTFWCNRLSGPLAIAHLLNHRFRLFFELIWRDVNQSLRRGAVQSFNLLKLAPYLVFAHRVDCAVPDFLAVDVDGPQCLPSTILGRHGGAVVAGV